MDDYKRASFRTKQHYTEVYDHLKRFFNIPLFHFFPKAMVICYVMLWPALTWRGQEWAQHVQGQLLHTCIMQIAGSPHVMELLTVSI